MASNISQIGDAINNVNYSLELINSTNILPNAIENTNNITGGWIGIIIFFIMALSVALYVVKFRQSFGLFDNLGVIFVSLSIALDVGIYLLIWEILTSYQIYFFMFTCYFVICFFSQIKKDMVNTET